MFPKLEGVNYPDIKIVLRYSEYVEQIFRLLTTGLPDAYEKVCAPLQEEFKNQETVSGAEFLRKTQKLVNKYLICDDSKCPATMHQSCNIGQTCHESKKDLGFGLIMAAVIAMGTTVPP